MELPCQQQDGDDHQRLEDERRPPADRGGDEPADERTGCRTDAAHRADGSERLGSRRQVGEEERREDVDGRDEQRGANTFEDGVADDEHTEPRRGGTDESTYAVDDKTHHEAAFAAVLVGQFPPGIISAAITSRKMVIATCTPWTVVSRSSLMSLIITFMLEPAKLQMN